jgi:hypothetical protein
MTAADQISRGDRVEWSAPIWHALMRYASRDLPAARWPTPAEVTHIDVCDPSGFLPTPYCPRVVREVFLLGTEPTHADTLYQPFHINKETGRLATFFTPLDQIEERVYFVPPPESEAWARAAGLMEQPPEEYDRIVPPAAANPDVELTAPDFFDIVSGVVQVQGTAAGEGFSSFGLQVGEGLDPQAWLQIGPNQESSVQDGVLGRWDTTGLNGAYILRLTVVGEDGSLAIAAIPVTVDNLPPKVDVVLPSEGATFAAPANREVPIQVEIDRDGPGASRDLCRRTTGGGADRGAVVSAMAAGKPAITVRARLRCGGNWADAAELTFYRRPLRWKMRCRGPATRCPTERTMNVRVGRSALRPYSLRLVDDDRRQGRCQGL